LAGEHEGRIEDTAPDAAISPVIAKKSRLFILYGYVIFRIEQTTKITNYIFNIKVVFAKLTIKVLSMLSSGSRSLFVIVLPFIEFNTT
jgi:hypothetical protein